MIKKIAKGKDDMVSILKRNKKNTNYVFLGIGLCLFVLNLTTFMAFIKTPQYSKVWFDIAIMSSIFIVIVATYNIFENN